MGDGPGAGKSSLIVAITRLVELSGGTVTVDQVDVSSISQQTLRSRLGVMSQDCLFFTGSLRYNLSPFGQHSDDVLQAALQEVGCTAAASSVLMVCSGGLDSRS